ncbi:MAG: rod shape-determining protein [Anaerolineales bacterium]|nr:rod shape-determining protein [Anaerolineales bacterium]
MSLFRRELGIDLGTFNVLVCEGGQIVLHEPSVVAISIREQKVLEIGQAAKDMYGRAPETIEVSRPLRDGVIADYDVTVSLLKYVIEKVCGPFRLFRPKVIITVPYGVTSVESRAVQEAVLEAGAGEAFLLPEPLAAAYGADLSVQTPTGSLVAVLGGGTTQAGVISMHSLVAANAARLGGRRLDEAIAGYVRKKYGLIIGDTTAEEIKLNIGAALPPEEEESFEIQGRDQVSGLPRAITLTTGEVTEALHEPLSLMVGTVKGVLEKTPPELASDIIERGMLLCGGTAQLRGIDRLMTNETGIPAYVAENPMACVALGAGRAFKYLDVLRRILPRP